MDGLLRVTSRLAAEIEDCGVPEGFEDMEGELHAVIYALPVLAGSLCGYGPGGYERHHPPTGDVAADIERLALHLKYAAALEAKAALGRK